MAIQSELSRSYSGFRHIQYCQTALFPLDLLVKRGMIQITEEGQRVLASGVPVDTSFLKRYPSFVKFQEKTSAGTVNPSGPDPSALDEYLQEFAETADKRFAQRPFVTEVALADWTGWRRK